MDRWFATQAARRFGVVGWIRNMPDGTVTLDATGTTATGTYPLTVTATNGTLTHTATTSLVITAAVQPDFSVAVTPSSQSIAQGGGTTYTATRYLRIPLPSSHSPHIADITSPMPMHSRM